MPYQKPRPRFHPAFESGWRVKTSCGSGKTQLKYLSDAVFPTGKMTLGYPGTDRHANNPRRIKQEIDPGIYPVLASYISRDYESRQHITFAFVTVIVTDATVTNWQRVGHFFTDSGDGCIVDTSLESVLRETRLSDKQDHWRNIRDSTLDEGDGRYQVKGTEHHAVIFRTPDWSYDCYIGLDSSGAIAKVLMDGRILRFRDFGLIDIARKVFG